MWPSALSGRLCIIVLVGLYPRQPTNAPQVHPRPIPYRMFHRKKMPPSCTSGFVLRFQSVFPVRGQVPYVLLTRSPLGSRRILVRLACIRHAASVHPEPGSNSPFDIDSFFLFSVICLDCFSGVSRNRRDFCFSRTCTIVFSFLSSFQRSSLP